MKILHTADLHLGQILYQWYDRVDEHAHFFAQLDQWLSLHRPDALVVSGDVFDIATPSASTKMHFNRQMAALHRRHPECAIVVVAGNHDSASRLEADAVVWSLGDVTVVGHGPNAESLSDPDHFIVELGSGFVVAIPFMANLHPEWQQAILDRVAERNAEGKPVVMTGHVALQGGDFTGHDDIGNQRVYHLDELPSGFDYLALGHIHRPQTLGFPLADEMLSQSRYAAPIARYSGSALHVSCDERYPHSVSLVEIDRHGGTVQLQRLGIEQLRHFYILPDPSQPALDSADEAETAIAAFMASHSSGYFRLRLNYAAPLPPDFQQRIYKQIEVAQGEVRFNPKHLWEGAAAESEPQEQALFAVADLQQMTNPLDFVRTTIGNYPDLDLASLEADFAEIAAYCRQQADQ